MHVVIDDTLCKPVLDRLNGSQVKHAAMVSAD